jgi:hypothetical protein
VSAAIPAPRPAPALPAVLALARVEARRLLRHPLFLAGLVLNALALVSMAGATSGQERTSMLSGMVALGLGIGTLLAANLAAMRDHRSGTGELLAPLPRGVTTRTTAQLLALLWTVPLSAAVVAIAYVAFGAGDGLVMDQFGTTRVPAFIELVQAPAGVLALGAAGVLLGRIAPTPLLGPLVVAGLLTVETVLTAEGSLQWLLPFAADMELQPDSQVPCTPTDSDSTCGVITGYDTAAMGVHLVYLAGMTAVCAAAALARRTRTRVAAAGAAVALVGLMLLAA